MRKKWGFERQSAAMVVSLLALFIALGGVGAIASGALSTKKVKKIAKKQVLALAPGLSVASAKKADDADKVGGASLGSLTIGRFSSNVGCDLPSNSSTFADCGTMTLDLPRSGRVFVDISATWRDLGAGPTTRGTCRLAVDGTAIGGTTTRYGQASLVFDTIDHRATLALNYVTDPLAAGAHGFRMECNDPTGSVTFSDGKLSAVMIGTD
jgi:hypothetical protein